MFWNDIKEIKGCMSALIDRVTKIECLNENISKEIRNLPTFSTICEAVEYIKENIEKDSDYHEKFDDYMKNIDKLNVMVNEFKGCVLLARSSIEERKKLNKEFEKTDIYCNKISAIHQVICKDREKKSLRVNKSHKKKALIQIPLS